ncbi:uncharacterized protein J3R85_016077 [Psidium guajava]|nr:uncharacterized protein J3R85_016077 [Psidium guajava]
MEGHSERPSQLPPRRPCVHRRINPLGSCGWRRPCQDLFLRHHGGEVRVYSLPGALRRPPSGPPGSSGARRLHARGEYGRVGDGGEWAVDEGARCPADPSVAGDESPLP